MEIVIGDTYTSLSNKAADKLSQLIHSFKDPLLCVASGDTPVGLYKNIVEKVNQNELDISNWSFLGLDEWVGMNGNDEGSCRFYLNQQLFYPLKISGDKICFFDGRATDLNKECKEAENFIRRKRGIDLCILGIGMNGHIGMNEPNTSQTSRSHITALDPITQKTGQKYFKKQQILTSGITLGLATLMESKNIFLMISGSHKAEIVKQMFEEQISEQIPGSLLRSHPGLIVFLDKEAAQLLSPEISTMN